MDGSIFLAAFGDQDYSVFCQRIHRSFGLRLADYKPDQMRRRTSALAAQSKCDSFTSYVSLLERDAAALGAFLDHVTINVTELLRNPKIFELLSGHIKYLLERSRYGGLNVWSAGCSYGAEAYSVALLLAEMDLDRQVRIKGTDVDLTMLAKANSPTFCEADMVNVSPARRSALFTTFDGATFTPNARLRSLVQFSRHDLLADEYPTDYYDLVICRNVLIYFTNEAKNRVYARMLQSLRPGGILFVGGTESVAEHGKLGFELVEPFFYRKPEAAPFFELKAKAA